MLGLNMKFVDAVRDHNEQRVRSSYYVRSYGCQQNVADSERIAGVLELLGFTPAATPEQSDIIIFNTCGVRHTADERILSNIGALKNLKKGNKKLIICVCGCMVEQDGMADFLLSRFHFVDVILGTNLTHKLPEALYGILANQQRFVAVNGDAAVVEGLPISRQKPVQCLVPVTYGCDNFCSYCVVPFLRGRERSREPERILEEINDALSAGAKEVVLLGQNVNSYGKGTVAGINFAELLRQIDALKGDFRVRFLTSHPKDCSKELVKTIANSSKICQQFHLPVQSGSNHVLKQMNRKYTREQYLDLLNHIRLQMPYAAITSDIIVGFPGESEQEFEETLDLVKTAKFNSLFTFIYSPRTGTKAAVMPDEVPQQTKKGWLASLIKEQELISDSQNAAQIWKVKTVLPEDHSLVDGKSMLTGKCEHGFVVEFEGNEELLGDFVKVKVEKSTRRKLFGAIVKAENAENKENLEN
jgi:tRNA-2-methylthio-N6-dimethylallyladenosine synthase